MNEVKDARENRELLNVYQKLEIKYFLKKIVLKITVCIFIGLLIGLILQPKNKNYRQYMHNPTNSKYTVLTDFNEIIKIKEKGTIYAYNEFKVEYDSNKDEYDLFTIYNPRIPMRFNSKIKLIESMEQFRSISRDNEVTPSEELEWINDSFRRQDLDLEDLESFDRYSIMIDGDVSFVMYTDHDDLDPKSVRIVLNVSDSRIDFVLEKNQLDTFIEDLFSAREYKYSNDISIITDGSNNEDLRRKLENEGNDQTVYTGSVVCEDALRKELSYIPSTLLEKLRESELLEIVVNGSILEQINEKDTWDYTIAGYYSTLYKYILIGGTESQVNWSLLHEIGHAFDSLEDLSRNANVYLSYKQGEIFFNSNYAYMNIKEYIAETFVLKMKGLLDEDTLINKEYDKILKKYK